LAFRPRRLLPPCPHPGGDRHLRRNAPVRRPAPEL